MNLCLYFAVGEGIFLARPMEVCYVGLDQIFFGYELASSTTEVQYTTHNLGGMEMTEERLGNVPLLQN